MNQTHHTSIKHVDYTQLIHQHALKRSQQLSQLRKDSRVSQAQKRRKAEEETGDNKQQQTVKCSENEIVELLSQLSSCYHSSVLSSNSSVRLSHYHRLRLLASPDEPQQVEI